MELVPGKSDEQMKTAFRKLWNAIKAIWYLTFGIEEDEGS